MRPLQVGPTSSSQYTFRHRVAVLPSVRSRLAPAARWLAPSAVAACAGALAAGVVEALAFDDAAARVAAAGFTALVAVPALLVVSAAGRGLAWAWQPSVLAASLREDGGGMPRLAGWVLTLLLGALGLAWATFQGTWQLAAWTAFKPLTVGFAQPVIAVGMVLLVAAASRPATALFASLARRLDARWRRGGRRTLLSPTIIVLCAAIASIAVSYVLWRKIVRPRTGPLATAVLHAPLIGLAASVLAHAAWERLSRARVVVGATLAALALAVGALAVGTASARPALTLAIWGQRAIAGVAIARLFDVDRIRDALPAALLRPSPRAGATHPDIVLITIDTVRADRTPPYGGTADMPVLRELSLRGATFNWAFAPSNVTARAVPSIALGTGPQRVRERPGAAVRLDPRHVTLVERLRAGGYETAGFVCCADLWSPASRTGLHRGFEHLAIARGGPALVGAVRTWFARRVPHAPERPLFTWLHVVEPRGWAERIAPGTGPRDDAERKRRYDAALAAADQQVGSALAALANRPRPAIVIVTADHGEALGDHGQPHHGTDLYNTQLRVPLVIAGPGISARRIQETVSLTDLAPTVLDLAGFAPPVDPGFDGKLVRRARDRRAPVGDRRRPRVRRDDRGSAGPPRPRRPRPRRPRHHHPRPLEADRQRGELRALRSPRRSRRALEPDDRAHPDPDRAPAPPRRASGRRAARPVLGFR